jgi:hypothetical protein
MFLQNIVYWTMWLKFDLHIHCCKDLKSYMIFKILFRCASFQNWLASLPDLLSSPTVPVTTVEVLSKLAGHNNQLFYRSLCQNLPDILSKYSLVCCTQYQNSHVPRWPNFIQWHLILLDPQYGNCFISPSWCLEFWGDLQIFGKFVHTYTVITLRNCDT